MAFIDEIKQRAKSNLKTIVLPETMDQRTLVAAGKVLEEGIANIILVGNKEKIEKAANGIDLSKATFVDPENYDKLEEYINLVVELRKSKGMTYDDAKKLLITNPLFFGVTMVKAKDADGMVAGAVGTSGETTSEEIEPLDVLGTFNSYR